MRLQRFINQYCYYELKRKNIRWNRDRRKYKLIKPYIDNIQMNKPLKNRPIDRYR